MKDDVVRLDVAMNDLTAVRFVERRAYLRDNLGSCPEIQWSMIQSLAQACPLKKFHHEVLQTIRRDSEVIDTDCVWVLQTRRCLCFPAETFRRMCVNVVLMENLDRDLIAD